MRSSQCRILPAAGLMIGLLAVATPAARSADSPTKDHAAAVAAIRQVGGTVRPIAKNGSELEVELQLNPSRATDDVLVHVGRLKNVVSLNLRGANITDAGLVHLKSLGNLRRLHLERTKITDAGIRHLAGLSRLEYLNLYGTKITDNALSALAGLKNLKRLYLWQTDVTKAGIAKLQTALPGLNVVRGVDLSSLPTYDDKEEVKLKPKEDLKWIATADAADAPKSANGINTTVIFENKSGKKVKLYWVSYGGELKQYAELDPGATRKQNTYARNTWLIADSSDKPLGYFIVGMEVSRAVIPKPS